MRTSLFSNLTKLNSLQVTYQWPHSRFIIWENFFLCWNKVRLHMQMAQRPAALSCARHFTSSSWMVAILYGSGAAQAASINITWGSSWLSAEVETGGGPYSPSTDGTSRQTNTTKSFLISPQHGIVPTVPGPHGPLGNQLSFVWTQKFSLSAGWRKVC